MGSSESELYRGQPESIVPADDVKTVADIIEK